MLTAHGTCWPYQTLTVSVAKSKVAGVLAREGWWQLSTSRWQLTVQQWSPHAVWQQANFRHWSSQAASYAASLCVGPLAAVLVCCWAGVRRSGALYAGWRTVAAVQQHKRYIGACLNGGSMQQFNTAGAGRKCYGWGNHGPTRVAPGGGSRHHTVHSAIHPIIVTSTKSRSLQPQ